MQLVLGGLEKHLSLLLRVVIRGEGENLAHSQIHPPLARPDVPYPLEQLIEIVQHACSGRVLQPLIVQHETLAQVLLESGRCPLAELRAAPGADAVADGEDGFEPIVGEIPGYLPRALWANL